MAEPSTAPADRGVAELEREVDQERARVSATIDALQSRASIGNLVDEVVKIVRDNGGDMGRNLGRTVRDNPLPALLTGVGLAWLMAGGSGRPARDWDDDYEPERYGSGRGPIPVGDRVGYDPDEAMGGGYGAEGDPGTFSDEPGQPGIGQRAADVASSVGSRVSHATDAIGDRASGMAHAAGDALSGGARTVRRAGSATADGLSRAGRRAAHMGGDARATFDTLVIEQPLVLGALALAVGAAIGGALPGSRAEDRMFGTRSERSKEALRRVAREQGQKLAATGKAVAAEAADIVDETSAEIADGLGEGRAMADAAADRIKDAASRLRDAGKEEAERQGLGRPKGD